MKKSMKKLVTALFICFCIGIVSPMSVLHVSNPVEVQAASAMPKLISAKPSGTTKAVIKWKTLKSAAGYRVYRSTDGKNWKKIKTVVGGKVGSYTDSKLTKGARYYYTVQAYRKKNGKTVFSAYDKKGLSVIAGLQTLKLNKTKITLYKGKSYTLKIGGTKLKPSWKSSAPSVAAVTSAGKVTAKKNGTAAITATLGGRKLTCNVTVKKQTAANATASYYTKLKNYLIKKGNVDSSGNPFVAYGANMDGDDCVWGILYEKAKDRYHFFTDMNIESEDSISILDMYLNVQKSGNVNVEYGLYYQEEYVILETSAAFAAKSYTGKKDINFKVDQLYGGSAADAKTLSNQSLQMGFLGWNQILKENLNFTMKNLGFTSLAI